MASAHENSDFDDFFDDPRDDTKPKVIESSAKPEPHESSKPHSSRSTQRSNSSNSEKSQSPIRSRSPSISSRSRSRSRSNDSRASKRSSRSSSPSPKNSRVAVTVSRRGGSGDQLADDHYSSDSSEVTDVSPLNSPKGKTPVHYQTPVFRRGEEYDISDDLPVKYTRPPSGNRDAKSYKRSGSSSSDLQKRSNDQIDMKLLMEVLDMEQDNTPGRKSTDRQRKVDFSPAGAKPYGKKNFSFSNDKVSSIDRENQRLMEQIMRYSQKGTEQKRAQAKKPTPRKPRPVLTPSALNRQREQQRIEQENLVFTFKCTTFALCVPCYLSTLLFYGMMMWMSP